jgi:hypothetical protein
MAAQDLDTLFRKKVSEHYRTELMSIQNQLGNMRDKTPAIENIRKGNQNKIKGLYTVNSENHQFTDSFRTLIIQQFFKIHNEFDNNQVSHFFQEELPKLKLLGKKNSGYNLGLDPRPKFDQQFIHGCTQEEILELISKAFVFKVIEIYIFQFLQQDYTSSERNDKLEILMNNKLGSLKDYDDEEKIINSDFPDFKKMWAGIFKITQGIKPNDGPSYRSNKKMRFILPVANENLDTFLDKLFALLRDENLIDIEIQDFKLHFTSQNFNWMKWKGDDIELVFLIKNLDIKNKNIHKDTCYHFRNIDGNPFKSKNLASLKDQLSGTYPRIENIIHKLKKKP